MLRAQKHVMPHREYIAKRNDQFFKENTYIFESLPQNKVEYYRDIIDDETRISLEDKNMLWDYLDVIVALVESYNKI